MIKSAFRKILTSSIVCIALFNSALKAQHLKYLQPPLNAHTKVVKVEKDDKTQFERIYYIDYAPHSKVREYCVAFDSVHFSLAGTIGQTYHGILQNLKKKPQSKPTKLPERWIKIYQYKGAWILFNDLPKFVLNDSCLITFDMDDPFAEVVTSSRQAKNLHTFELLSYNWENPDNNLSQLLQIKILDTKKMIALWRFEYHGELTYYLMIAADQVSSLPVMVLLTTDFMGDEDEIFDKLDYDQLWNK